jgi:hypothetical protein
MCPIPADVSDFVDEVIEAMRSGELAAAVADDIDSAPSPPASRKHVPMPSSLCFPSLFF